MAAKAKVYHDEVDRLKGALALTAERLGLKDKNEKWVILPGSIKRNLGWKLVVARGDKLVAVDFLPGGKLGDTAREAAATLVNINNAWLYLAGRIRSGSIKL